MSALAESGRSQWSDERGWVSPQSDVLDLGYLVEAFIQGRGFEGIEDEPHHLVRHDLIGRPGTISR